MQSLIQSKKGLTLIVLTLFFALSYFSNYNLISPYEMNFDIATMLTPYGISKHYLLQDTYLTKFFGESTLRESAFSRLSFTITFVLLHLMTWTLILRLRKK